jgi:hypothetical protein
MKKNIFIVVLFLFGLTACNKPKPVDPATKIEGRLMDIGTEIPILNTRVRLIEITSKLPSSASRFILQSTTSDEKGLFTFNFQWTDPLKTYEVDAVPNDLEKYYEVPVVKERIQRGEVNKINCLMSAYGWIKYRVRNTSPYDNRDTIRFLGGMFTGINVDKTVILRQLKRWDQPDSTFWWITRNNIATLYQKPITIVPHDTISFDINY